jgi:hypothetical protein
MFFSDEEDKRQAELERKRYIAWWKNDEPRKPLPEDLQLLLDNHDHQFIAELLKFAYRFNARKYYDHERRYWYYRDSELSESNASWIWSLYVDENPLARAALRILLDPNTGVEVDKWIPDTEEFGYQSTYSSRENFIAHHKWRSPFFRYLKGIYKSAEMKKDALIWSVLAYRYDFNKYMDTLYTDTYKYLRRRSWRTLRNLGQAGSADYVPMATEVLLCYTDRDNCGQVEVVDPKTQEKEQVGVFTHLWLLNHILYYNSSRFTHNSYQWKAVSDNAFAVVPEEREEAFPELWDQRPDQLWRLIRFARATPVIQFAVRALRSGNPQFIERISLEQLNRLLHSDHRKRRLFATEELIKRLDPKKMDWKIWYPMIFHSDQAVRRHAKEFIYRYHDHWSVEEMISMIKESSLLEEYIQEWDRKESVNYGVFSDWLQLLQGPFKEAYQQIAVIEWSEGWKNSNVEVIHSFITFNLSQVNIEKHPYEGKRLLPFMKKEVPEIQQAAREVLAKDYIQLNIDAEFLAEFACIPYEEHQSFVTPFFQERILWLVPFIPELLQKLWIKMTRPEVKEEVRTFIREELLGNLFWNEVVQKTSIEKVLRLLHSTEMEMQEFGTRLLKAMNPDPEGLAVDDLISLTHNPIAEARKIARDLLIKVIHYVDEYGLVNLVETDWDDTRNWGFGYLETLSSEQVTPKLVYGLLDSAREDVHEFAKRFVQIHSKIINKKELMLRASESTHLKVQEYALELAEQVEWDVGTLSKLELFFRTVLFRVNEGRKAKKMAFALLLRLGEQSAEMAEVIIPILADLAHNSGKKDFEQILLLMTRVKNRYPQVQTPIQIH